MKKYELNVSEYKHMKTIANANKKWLAKKYVDPEQESYKKKMNRLRKAFNIDNLTHE
jgi:hypothetical protein